MRLILMLIAGIVAGIVVGLLAPLGLVRGIATFQHAFGQFISFVMPLLIFFFIAEGIANLNYGAGKILGWTTGIAYASTLGAGALAAFVGLKVIPMLSLASSFEAVKAVAVVPFVKLDMLPVMGVMTALVMAFVWGIGVGNTKAAVLRQGLLEGKRIIDGVISYVIIPVLPFYIGALFVEMTVAGEVVATLRTFGLVLCLAVGLHLVWLFTLYTIAATVAGINVFTALKNMIPAYITAIGTMSSVATIPVTLRQTLKNKVDEDVADFVIPLCATIHLSGSTITLTTASIAVMLLTQGMLPTWGMLVPFIVMLGITMVAAPGVPGGAVMAALGLFSTMLGFSEAAVGLMITLYVAQDSFGTACNVTGDGAIALIVNRLVRKDKRLGDAASQVAWQAGIGQPAPEDLEKRA
ncbi:MAG: dicarboxylate/amino acid:cation symporter [Gammaproteobacteria bacterium]